MKTWCFVILCAFALCDGSGTADASVVGNVGEYTVVKGDTLRLIGSRLGVSWQDIARDNNMDLKAPMKVGQKLKVDTRKIVPRTISEGIIVNIPDRTLYYFRGGRVERTLPVALGMPDWRGMTQWRTPTGEFTIMAKQKDPTWHVPRSMQWKMEREEKPVKSIVPPGPDNPLGRYAMTTSIPGVVIHETIWPTSINRYQSHGCIRLLPEHMESFFGEVERGTRGEIIYQPVKVAVTDQGKVLVQVHRDIYGKVKDYPAEAKRMIESLGVGAKVSWPRLEQLLQEKTGRVEDVTL